MDTLKEIQDYFESLCEKHKNLLHNSTNRRAFARFMTESHIIQITRNGTTNIVVVSEVSGRRIGDIDSKKIQRGISLIFAVKSAAAGLQEEAVAAAMHTSESIMFDFISKMEVDAEAECLLNYDLEKLSWEPIDAPWLDNYYGWELFIPFQTHLQSFNPDNWNE